MGRLGLGVRVSASYSTYSVVYRLVGRLGLGLAVILMLIVVRTYPHVCPRRAHDVAAMLRHTRRSRRPRGRGLASSRQSRVMSRQSRAACGEAAYNLVKYYLAFAFKLFYYVLFDL